MASLPAAAVADTVPTAIPDQTHSLAPAIIEVDIDEVDSTFGLDAGGSTYNYGSITSSILNYRQENGRTYHAYSDGKYLVPNDEKEQERMDIVYHAIATMFEGKAFFSPVKNPQRIVDMGTGTGIWALDVGDEYPKAHVVGIDLSPIQSKWTCPNVEFRVDDFEKPWIFGTPLDLVHSRCCSGLGIRNWPKYLAEAYRCLRPGGWVETQDFTFIIYSDDDSIPKDSNVLKWHTLMSQGMLLAGCNMSESSADIKSHFEEAGFVNVQIVDTKLPIGPWPKDKKFKDAGSYAMLSCLNDISGMSLALFTRLLGWNSVELEVFLGDVKSDWMRKGVHAYWPLFAVYGQKPESNEKEVEVGVSLAGESAI